MTSLPRLPALGLILALAALAACDTAEERSEVHYERGMALLAEGKYNQALLEFKTALKLNEDAVPARMEFARIRLRQGELKGAIGNYLKVIELDEDNIEARVQAGRLILQVDDETATAREHIYAAEELEPDNEEVRALIAALAQKEKRFETAARKANELLADAPGNITAVSVLVAQRQAAKDYRGIIKIVDEALVAAPDELPLHLAKLQALESLENQEAVGAQLTEMVSRFPDNAQVAKGRIQWFINNDMPKEAVKAQRALSAQFPEEPVYALEVAALLHEFEGEATARGYLTELVASGEHVVPFNRALADFEYQQGNLKVSATRLGELLTLDLSQRDKHDTQAQMARTLREAGDLERAREIVEEVLRRETDHVEALKVRALTALDDDKPHSAISDLRSALSAKQGDSTILMMLAMAHERNGSPTLAQERLALAVQNSDQGVIESLRYAEFLARQDKAQIALSILKDALEKHGDVPILLAGLGQVQLAAADWRGATETVSKLALRGDDPDSLRMAQELQVAILTGEQRFEESVGVLRQMWDLAGERTSAMENLVGNYLRAEKTVEAAQFLENILKNDPANLRATLLRGAVHAFVGELTEAEARYRKAIEDHPLIENGYGALANLLAAQGRQAEADDVIKAGINTAQNATRLLFSRATRLEQEGDFEGAIAVYEELYATNKTSDVLANNLAALLSEVRDDPEDLERAYNIAKRLRASDQPAFLDTYGWVLYKKGEYELALPTLEKAVRGAPNNAYVQYHLGMLYEKLGKTDLAIKHLELSLQLGRITNLPLLEEAKNTLERLRSG